MKTILKLWRGELSEEVLYNPDVKGKLGRKPLDEKIIKEAEEFSNSLSEEQRQLLLSYWMMESEKWSEEIDWAFAEGFKLGARHMMDILEE